MSERVIPILEARKKRPKPLPAIAHPSPVEGAALLDSLGRPLSDLRISVTDRCNFRCVYCMPKEVFGSDHPYLARSQLLTFEEIVRVARIFRDLGVKKIRLTGGEPLLRRNIEKLVEMLAALNVDLAMTTNGSLLGKKARSLRDAGLSRLTVSLDALDDATFRATNDVDFPVADVLDGIEAAAAAGFGPIKVNMVVKQGLNEDQILPMARHFKSSGHILRFIEYMDVGASNDWRMNDVVPAAEIVRRIHAEMPLDSVEAHYRGEVAERWRYRDGTGEIGVIASVTQAFCQDCTRLRLSTEGMLYTCLFASQGYDMRPLIRPERGRALPDDAVADTIAAIWRERSDRYSEQRTANTPVQRERIEMSYIGG